MSAVHIPAVSAEAAVRKSEPAAEHGSVPEYSSADRSSEPGHNPAEDADHNSVREHSPEPAVKGIRSRGRIHSGSCIP